MAGRDALSTAAAVATAKLLLPLTLILHGCGGEVPADEPRISPAVDHHSHLISPDALSLLQGVGALPPGVQPFTSDDMVAALDSADVERAVLGSVGYFFASGYLPEPLAEERARLEAENDWNVQQAARHPGRLVVFCGLNPSSEYAIEEVARCRGLPHIAGIKLHFDNSGVDVLDRSHVSRLREVFQSINEHGLALLVHLRVLAPDYGREYSHIFIEELLSVAPDVPIQVAHLAGSGPGDDADEAFLAFAEAGARGDPRLANVYFDVASNLVEGADSETLALIAERLRMAGLERILFGSDYAGIMNEPPYAAWAAFSQLPLTSDELRQIARNTAPYMQ